jgi:hypothetical protein
MNYSDQDSEALATIIDDHLRDAESRINTIYEQHFGNAGAVFSRHIKHWKDAPKDLGQPFLGLWNVTARKLQGKPPVYFETGKRAELVSLISNELLELPELEKKICDHIRPFQESVQEEIQSLLDRVPEDRREKVERELKGALENLDVPVETLRDVAATVLMGCASAVWGTKGFVYGTVGAGQSLVTAIWAANLGWYGGFAYWVSGTTVGGWISGTWVGGLLGISGAPAWVSVAGGAGGFLAAIVLIPVMGPVCEWGVNKFKGRSTLDRAVQAARDSLIGDQSKTRVDETTVLAKTYQYGDMLNNLANMVRSVVH